ncbi:MAG: SDR family NAD(P)-dependent oxidoreductase, partial [Novosphingobium sp.]
MTGGGGGIGRAIAICLAAHGADVAVMDVIPDRCDETVVRIAELVPAGLA